MTAVPVRRATMRLPKGFLPGVTVAALVKGISNYRALRANFMELHHGQ
jgi:hypothetical protein